MDSHRLARRTVLAGLASTAAATVLGSATSGCGRPTDRPAPATDDAPRLELVAGPGAWCWFQGARGAIDGGMLWLGTSRGTSARAPGTIEVTQIDLERLAVVARTALAQDRVDDHTSPSVLPVSGELQVGWAPHRRVDWLELGTLGQPLQRIVRPGALTDPGRGTSYVSAHVVAGRRWVLYRGESFSWNLLTSSDGATWQPHGLVVRPAVDGDRPYVVAASDGDVLHLLVSDANPTERLGTSVHHATIDADLRVRTTDGTVVGSVGSDAPTPLQLTTVVAGRAGTDEDDDTDAWMVELRIIDGRPVGVVSVRDPWPAESILHAIGRWRHEYRLVQLAPDGSWSDEHLAWAGSELYANQPDYTGLASVHPTIPGRAVVSTDVHPVSGQPLRSSADARIHHELFLGDRRDDGTWVWRALTANSRVDHLRPLLLADDRHEVVAWMRGEYRHWTDFDTDLVVRRI